MTETVTARPGTPPFDVELVILEEDTFLVLSAGNVVFEIREDVDSRLRQASDRLLFNLSGVFVAGTKSASLNGSLFSQ
ncbi:MAG TPA: hypothetical protein QF611_04725 [Pseudomonadales bacterium]|nr:hypothetical protein [Pseudomonadales bacterium]MDP6316340.1 hypothetical protein [Pseudomonadales bacterium]MDP7314930.1 hypothetical protein [Pseudomonadales bacterium]HJP50316.1 hypothetical protein [Pseudomonadales bacterium]